ncbi:MAG: methionyl-tRNA formyltransferase [Patescibacteria group bacterium]|nr:MAG: methionyl-tRNA formyltransferase [Patescibacteria group bacterium]
MAAAHRTQHNIVFFGTPQFAVYVLEELENIGLVPSLVVTAPDRPAGRKLTLTPPPVKVWAEKHSIPVLQPEKLDDEFRYKLQVASYKLFIVAAYGKILPKEILDIPEHGTLNVHPSLLPKYRGPSPIESAILSGDEETGIAIMLVDEEMDHGPILESRTLTIGDQNKEELGEKLFRLGGQLLADIIPKLIDGEIKATPQDHALATYTKKIVKGDGLIDLSDDPKTNWRKFRAYRGWPGTYFFTENGARVKITDAEFKDGEFIIKKVIPEGKKEVVYRKSLL